MAQHSPVGGILSAQALSGCGDCSRAFWTWLEWQIDASHSISLGYAIVGASGYRAGGYSDSALDVTAHGLGLSFTKDF